MKQLLIFIMTGFFNLPIVTSITGCDSQSSSQQHNLNNLILTTNLGAIWFAGNIPNKTELLQGIKDTNLNASNLTADDFSLKDIPTETRETIIGMGKYLGQVTVDYAKNTEKTNLNSIITTTDLQNISSSSNSISKKELFDAIISNNPIAKDFKINEFGFNDIPTATNATIVGIGKYVGEVTLTYILN